MQRQGQFNQQANKYASFSEELDQLISELQEKGFEVVQLKNEGNQDAVALSDYEELLNHYIATMQSVRELIS